MKSTITKSIICAIVFILSITQTNSKRFSFITPEEYILGCWFQPHAAFIQMKFRRNGQFEFNDYNSITDKEEVLELIKDNAGKLCVSVNIFDEFTKEIEIKKDSQENSIIEKKIMKSLGYRLVYQDNIRTLTDEEVNTYSDKVYEVLKSKGFEIR